MKKIISMITLVAMIVTVCSLSAFAAYESTLTMSSNAVDNAAIQNQDVIVSTTLGTSKGIKTLGFKFTFDNRDFDLGVSKNASEYYMNSEYEEDLADYDGDWEALTKDFCGHYSYVDDTYHSTWKTYTMDEKNISGLTTTVYEDGNTTTVMFAYARDTAITNAKKITDMLVGGIVLNVKTSEKKQGTITLTEATASGSDGEDTLCTIANSITLNLNGYTGEEPDPTPTDKNIAEDFSDNVNLKDEGYYAGSEPITSGTVSYGDYSAEMGANGKVHTFFAKAAADLEALSYGVEATINGNKYKFPGKAKVEKGKAWAIKIVIPNGTFQNATAAEITSMEKYIEE